MHQLNELIIVTKCCGGRRILPDLDPENLVNLVRRWGPDVSRVLFFVAMEFPSGNVIGSKSKVTIIIIINRIIIIIYDGVNRENDGPTSIPTRIQIRNHALPSLFHPDPSLLHPDPNPDPESCP